MVPTFRRIIKLVTSAMYDVIKDNNKSTVHFGAQNNRIVAIVRITYNVLVLSTIQWYDVIKCNNKSPVHIGTHD